MIDFTLSGKNVYKIYFVSKFKTEEYFIQASTEDEVMEFLIFECYIFPTILFTCLLVMIRSSTSPTIVTLLRKL